ncbi:hypothetical protein VI817_005649 [Penicillium citrinum]|nr:hypothetical protein VI817_005649 [Penicillium citrinum]
MDASTTPLALAAYHGDSEIAKHLVSHGAEGALLDSMGRNTLHGITKYLPDRHGYLPHQWHYWIRHGNWDNHLMQLTDLVKILVGAGADLNAKDKGYPPMTPVAAAADLGVWDGGVISALLAAGADLKESLLSAGDTVLHCWVSITGPRLAYPKSYIPTLRRIVQAMPSLDIPNKYEEDTPLHLLTTIYHSEDEFEAACNVLLSHSTPADINRKTRRGESALSIALEAEIAPEKKGRFLLGKGANATATNCRGRDIFYSIANNAVLSDQNSHDLMLHFLDSLGPNPQEVYEIHYLNNKNSHDSLAAAAARGKPRTLALLLSIGLSRSINQLDRSKSTPWTPLDQALHSAEISRRAHIEGLASYKAGVSRSHALEQNLVYDGNQGPPVRAAEAYKDFPDVIRILQDAGAKRRCDLEDNGDGNYIAQPSEWDKNEMPQYGFKPETQPNVEAWQGLYELARYKSGWKWLDVFFGGKKR